MESSNLSTLPKEGTAAARLRKSNFFTTLRDMMEASLLPRFAGTSKALAASIQECNGKWDAIACQADKGIVLINDQLNNCGVGHFSDVLLAVENFNLDKLQLAQRVAQQWGVALGLAERQAAELAKMSQPLFDEAEALLVEVKEGLTSLGSGLESHPGYPANVGAAELQFDFAARVQNLRCRAAFEKANDTVEQHRAAVDDVGRKKLGLEKAAELLQKLAIEAVTR